jgi:hypothetical protein
MTDHAKAIEAARRIEEGFDMPLLGGDAAIFNRKDVHLLARAFLALQSERASVVEECAAQEAIAEALQWIDAYPDTVFLPVSEEKLAEANDALKAIGVDMGALHAGWARHLLDGIGGILRRALSPPPSETPQSELVDTSVFVVVSCLRTIEGASLDKETAEKMATKHTGVACTVKEIALRRAASPPVSEERVRELVDKGTQLIARLNEDQEAWLVVQDWPEFTDVCAALSKLSGEGK